MNTISFRQLQRMTVKQILEMCPLTVTVDGESTFKLITGTQLKEKSFVKERGELNTEDYI
uniref:Uncharacterized protein n=1 Tax=viral metagenome TaxID=1070528 RepID=A0A6M3KCU7_9ZZZZ